MGDRYWNRQQPLLPSPGVLKRLRSDVAAGLHSAPEMHNYASRDDDHAEVDPRSVRDTKAIGSAYDRYLQSMQLSSLTSGEASSLPGSVLGRAPGNKLPGVLVGNHVTASRPKAVSPDIPTNGRNSHYGNQVPVDVMVRPARETIPLPPDASNTLYVEGLPSDISKREVAHIFRPFVGYKQLRLVNKESKLRGDPLILCFVDFMNPACAATAMSALQGYQMDEQDPDSNCLRLQFSRYPGPRTAPGSSRR